MKFLITCFLFVALSSFAANPPYTAFKGAGGIVVTTNPPNGDIIIDGSSVVSSGTNSSMQVSTNNVAASTMASNINFTAGNNTVLKGTNIGSTAHINYGIASNLSFYAGADELVLGTWGTSFGFSNAAAGGFILLVDDPTLGNDVSFGGTIAAQHAMFYLLGGTGDYLAVDAGGTTFRTNAPSTTDTNIGVGQTLYLDKTFGNDATASRTNMLRPFQTVSNAIAAMLSGDTLVVRGGAYPINPKADATGAAANWNFQAGVALTNKNNIRIVGEPGVNWYMTGWRDDGTALSMPMIRFENCTNVLFENITLSGMRTNVTVYSHAAVTLNNVSELTMRGCTLSNWQNHGIVFQDDGGTFDINSHLNFIGNTYAGIGGTNHITLVTDGVAIGAGGVNLDVIRNHFYNNLRDIEYCCDEFTRKVHISLNTSEGCYFDHIMITGTNSSEIIVANNIAKGYANFVVPGASADSSKFLNTYAGSNILVQGNIVGGFASGIASVPTVGTMTVDWRIVDNSFVDFTGYPVGIPTINLNMVGFNALVERITVKGNYFLNCTSAAVVINGNNSAVNDNTFIDCNIGGYFHGVVSIGWPTAGVATNSTNISIVGNRLISSAANAGPAIAIYGMSHSNVVHGNEIDRKFATNLHNLSVGMRTRPVNGVAVGSLLRSDANGDERAVTLGGNMTWDGTTLNSTGGSGTPGGSTYSLQMNTNDTFFGDLLAQYFPYNSVTEAGGYITMAVGGGSTTTNAMGANFFGAIGPHGFGLYTSNSARWLLPARGHFEPTTSNYLNVGSLLLPIGTNFHMSLQQHPNARNNRTMRSDDNGFGSWSPNPAGGSGFGPAGTFASMGGIQFAQTNELGDGMALDSTNLFRYDRASNEMIVTNTTSTSNTVIGAGYVKTRLLEASNVNVSTLVVTNGIPAAGAEGNVQYNKGGVLGAEAAFSYDDSDDTLTVTSLVVQSMAILPNAGAGKVLTSDANGVGSWQANTGGFTTNELPMVYQTNLAQGMPYDSYPVTALDGTDVVMVYRRANIHANTNSSLWMTRTKNAGASWETPFLARTNAGWDIGGFAFGIHATSGRYHILHQMRSVTNGEVSAPLAWFSDDKGTNWTAGGAIANIGTTNDHYPFARILTAAVGRLICGYYWISNDWGLSASYALTSDDDGVTWTTNFIGASGSIGHAEPTLAYLGGSNLLVMVRLEDKVLSSTNRFAQFVSTNNGATWTFVNPIISMGVAASNTRSPLGMHVYRDPVDGLRIQSVIGARSATGTLVVRDVSAKRVWEEATVWNSASSIDIPERGAIGTSSGGGYASPIWLSDKSETICAYYFEISDSSAGIRFIQLPRR